MGVALAAEVIFYEFSYRLVTPAERAVLLNIGFGRGPSSELDVIRHQRPGPITVRASGISPKIPRLAIQEFAAPPCFTPFAQFLILDFFDD